MTKCMWFTDGENHLRRNKRTVTKAVPENVVFNSVSHLLSSYFRQETHFQVSLPRKEMAPSPLSQRGSLGRDNKILFHDALVVAPVCHLLKSVDAKLIFSDSYRPEVLT